MSTSSAAVAGMQDPRSPAKSGPPLLAVRGLSKWFGETQALAALDLDVWPGEVHALLGENGSGKSTVIKILSGYHEPDSGSVHVDGEELSFASPVKSYELGLRFIHQDLGLIESMSVTDNLLLNAGYPSRAGTVRDRQARAEARELLSRADVDVDPRANVDQLGPALRTGVAVARALRRDDAHPTKLLVFDEPTATLPADQVRHLLGIIRAAAATGVGVLYVTHRLDEVPVIADNLTVLRDGSPVAREGAKGISHQKLVQLLVGDELAEVAQAVEALRSSGRPVLGVSNVESSALVDVTFEVHSGEVVGIAGVTGSGSESLLATLFGGTLSVSGQVSVHDRLVAPGNPAAAIAAGMGYLPADRKTQGGIMELTARENVTLADVGSLWRAPFLRARLEDQQAREWFEKLDVRPAGRINQPLATFSGGNQQKILLAKWLRIKPDVLLLDEPTQGVDISSKADIHRHLLQEAQRGAAVVVSSTDVDELAAICTRVLVLRRGRIVATLLGHEISAAAISRQALRTETTGSDAS